MLINLQTFFKHLFCICNILHIFLSIVYNWISIAIGCQQGKVDKKSSPPKIQLKNGTIFDNMDARK